MDKIYALMTALYTGVYDRDESEDRGAGMVEYALLVALIGVVLIATINPLTTAIGATFTAAKDAL